MPFGVSQDYEYVLAYVKTSDFEASIDGGKRRYITTDDFPNKPWRYHDMSTQRTADERPNSDFTIINPKNGEEFPVNRNAVWRITRNDFQKYYDEHRIIFPGDYEFLKISRPVLRYWKEDDEKKAGDKFGQISVSTKLPDNIGMSQDGTKEITEILGEKVFLYPKSSTFLKFFFKIASKPDSIILDFFAGSGTTGHAVLDLNRSEEKEGDLFADTNTGGNRTFILCQMNEKTDTTPNGIAYDVTAKRLKRIMTGECYDGTKDFEWIRKNKPYGGNLDVYEIDKVADFEYTEGKSPFDVIDETLYGQPRFATLQEKIDWVCSHFGNARKQLEK